MIEILTPNNDNRLIVSLEVKKGLAVPECG
jgi:hypothetical protein